MLKRSLFNLEFRRINSSNPGRFIFPNAWIWCSKIVVPGKMDYDVGK